jgi:hypothetical protein
MRRLALTVVLLATLAAAPSAAGKEIQSVTACGAGDCATSKADGLLAAMTDVGPPTDGPARPAPFYRLTVAVGDGGKALGRFRSWWVPSEGLLLGEDGTWMAARPAVRGRLHRLTRGLRPRPAAQMPGATPSTAPAVGTVTPPQPAPLASSGDLPVVPLLAALTLLVLAGLIVRRRVAPS